jgi:outer membrane protein insertion porin family
VAGLGGDVKYLRSAVDARFYFPVVSDVAGVLRGQAGQIMGLGSDNLRMLDHFQMGPNLVRGFAPAGIGPRDLSTIAISKGGDALGGSMYWGASVEAQSPIPFLPRDIGLKAAVFADAGSLWSYQGPRTWAVTGETVSGCAPGTAGYPCSVADGMNVRASVGAGLIWNSPFGPLRFDYAVPVMKQSQDVVQQFRFGGGTKF